MNIDKGGYLVVTDLNFKVDIPIHRYIKRKEAKQLAQELNCGPFDIRIHHIDERKENNCWNNLEPLHKDKYSEIHGLEISNK